MGRALFILVLIVGIGYGLDILAAYNERIALGAPLQTASVIDAGSPISMDFSETGTLVFYPNNVGPVPYLFYQDRIGHTVAKALVFLNSSPADFSLWSGARVSIQGSLESEHVVVGRILYISAP